MQKEVKREKLPQEELEMAIRELTKLLTYRLQVEIKEVRESLSRDIIPHRFVSAIRELAMESVIEIPIEKFIRTPKKLTKEELEAIHRVREIKGGFNITQEELARILRVSLRTVAGWLHLASGPRRIACDRIAKVYEILHAVQGVIKPQFLRDWLFSLNEILGDSVFNLLEKGEFQRILDDIEALKEGVFV